MNVKRSVTVLCLALLAGLLPVSAGAATALNVTEGTVTHVADGDTIDVRIAGTVRRVRLTGIQAMEIGDCHADRATARLKALVDGKTVRLSAADPASMSGARLLRQVNVQRDGAWVDTGKVLIDEGHAFWSPHRPENFVNEGYRLGSQRAAAAKQNLWDPARCRVGPQQDANVRIWAKGDADGVDAENLNDEWVKIQNRGTSALNLAGWRVRDGALRWYTFPAGASVPAGGLVTLHVGSGKNSASHYYWGLTAPIFDNPSGAPDHLGDGAYVFDPDGDVRWQFQYPCVDRCTDPMIGKATVAQVNADAPGDDNLNPNGEWVDVRNTSTGKIDLHGYVLERGTWSYDFGLGTTLAAGATLRLHVGKGTDTALRKYWGKSSAILPNGGGTAVLRTPDYIQISCRAWGTGSCQDPVRITGDWNGDGTSTPGWFKDGLVQLRNANSSGAADVVFRYGGAGDVPVVGDWDGNGSDTIGVRRGATWHLRNSNSAGAAQLSFSYGKASDVPVVGDWDGKGGDSVGVRRGATWYLRNANSAGAAQLSFSYGKASDVPVVGDWDGKGGDSVGVRRGGTWYLRNANSAGAAQLTFNYGQAADLPVTGDWNRSGGDTVGVVRESVWHLRNANSSGGAHLVAVFQG